MRKLILALVSASLTNLSQGQEISQKSITSKFLTVVKDAQVEQMLEGSSEFSECKKKYEFKASDQKAEKEAKLKEATDCFKKKLSNRKGEDLKKLAIELKLESHGLIKSKNVSEITTYLSNKMTKALTGKDPDEKDPKKILESLKWKNQKIVDQKVFIDLYTNQLMKNALFEVSRFCFENLRVSANKSNPDKKNFTAQWLDMQNLVGSDGKPNVSALDDSGEPSYFQLSAQTDVNKKEEVYSQLIRGLSDNQQINGDDYARFFNYCQQALPLLCDNFKSNSKVTSASKNEITDTTNLQSMTKGASACLTMDRLKNLKTLMENTDKVAKQFEEMSDDKDEFALQMITNPQIYQRGKGNNEESLDELTSVSSNDILESKLKSDQLEDMEKKCSSGGGKECDEFLLTNDDLEKAIFNKEADMNLQREIEVAKVKELKADDLKKFLEDNGHFDLLNKLNDNSLTEDQIAEEIGKIYDARKVAEIENLKLKVGKRQISETAAKNLTDDDKKKMILNNIKDSKEERARIAQVMMFNNIITSQLSLTDKDTNKTVGRNVSGWKKEYDGLKGSSINTDLFQNIQNEAEKNTSTLEDTSVVGGGIIDMILGKEEKLN